MARLLFLLVLLSGCTPAIEHRYYPVQRDVLGYGVPVLDYTEIQASEGVPPNTLTGVVIDAATGAPVEIAQVSVIGTNRGTLTDSVGRFIIAIEPRDVIRVAVLGYEITEVEVPGSDGTGYTGRLALRPGPVELCIDYIEPPPLFQVHVRSALTGEAPDSARLKVHWAEGEAETVERRSELAGYQRPLVLEAGPYKFGVYVVEVSSPGFSTWRQIYAIDNVCGSPVPVNTEVWLVPTSAAGA